MTEKEFQDFKRTVVREQIIHRHETQDWRKHKELFLTPCIICGDPEHTMLHPFLTEEGKVIFHYSCPVAYCENWEDACRLNNPMTKYMICPDKFAREHLYNHTEIHRALDRVINFGYGKNMSTGKLRALRNDILHICSSHKADESIILMKLMPEIVFVIVGIIFAILIGLSMTQGGSQL
jgi:hypothetical protein